MKTTLFLAFMLGIGASQAAITVTLSGTTNVLTGLTVDGSSTSQRLAWGIVVDAAGDGFQAGSYLPTGLQTKLGAQTLSTSTGLTDDVLYFAGSVFSVSGTGDGSTGFARPLSATNIALSGNVGTGDSFAIIWFDIDNVDLGATTITATANTNVPSLISGLKYGMLTGTGPTAQTIPTDGQTRGLTANFSGTDPVRTASFALIPEPSAALLGAIGALGLLRRRRN